MGGELQAAGFVGGKRSDGPGQREISEYGGWRAYRRAVFGEG